MPAPFPPQNVFIFRPGGTNLRGSAGVPVYTDFGELYADLTASALAKTIIFDDSNASPCVIPAGSYDMDGVVWAGAGSTSLANGGRVRVEFATGVTITNLHEVRGLFVHLPVGVSTPITYNGGGSVLVKLDDCTFQVAATASPLVVVSNTTTLLLLADGGTTLGGTAEEWLGLVDVDTVDFNLRNGSRLLDDSITSGVNAVIGSITLDASSSFNTNQPQFQGTGGVPAFSLGADAANLGYTPGTAGNWGTVPADVSSALDGIAGETGVPQGHVYVSAVGNDSNTGLTPGRAKLTLASAITAASSLGPTTNNRIAIQILDAASYSGTSFTLPGFVSLFGPHATLSITGTLSLGNSSRVVLHRIISSGTGAVIESNTAQGGWITADVVQNTSSGNGVNILNGSNYLNLGGVFVTTGAGIGITGGVGVYCLGRVNTIFSNGNCVNVGSTPNVQLSIDRLEGSGTGLRVVDAGGVGDFRVGVNLCSTAYDAVSATSTINVVAVRVTGTTSGSGTVNEIKAVI